MDEDQEIHLATNDARAGSTPHIVRYALVFSLTLAVLAMVITLWFFAF